MRLMVFRYCDNNGDDMEVGISYGLLDVAFKNKDLDPKKIFDIYAFMHSLALRHGLPSRAVPHKIINLVETKDCGDYVLGWEEYGQAWKIGVDEHDYLWERAPEHDRYPA